MRLALWPVVIGGVLGMMLVVPSSLPINLVMIGAVVAANNQPGPEMRQSGPQPTLVFVAALCVAFLVPLIYPLKCAALHHLVCVFLGASLPIEMWRSRRFERWTIYFLLDLTLWSPLFFSIAEKKLGHPGLQSLLSAIPTFAVLLATYVVEVPRLGLFPNTDRFWLCFWSLLGLIALAALYAVLHVAAAPPLRGALKIALIAMLGTMHIFIAIAAAKRRMWLDGVFALVFACIDLAFIVSMALVAVQGINGQLNMVLAALLGFYQIILAVALLSLSIAGVAHRPARRRNR